jgi:hypothetical protein
MEFNTPILLIVFNRPEKTLAAINNIRNLHPRYLYVAGDGPREGNIKDQINCSLVKEIIESNIDWPCKVITNFNATNLGCGLNVSKSITWFFDNVKMGIILEDDCLPELSFFRFCEEMLNKYELTEKIMCISGNNFNNETIVSNEYYFSKYMHCWGWASWRQSWKKYDFSLSEYHNDIQNRSFINTLGNAKEQKFWLKTFKKIILNEIDTWDYQWQYSIFKNEGLVIIPGVNLVKNIGFDNDATHTKNKEGKGSELNSSFLSFPLIHPINIVRNETFDFKTYKLLYHNTLKNKLLNKIKSLFK